MAQRYGGKFSPNSQDSGFRGAARTRAGGRVNLLFLAPLPMLWQAFTSAPAQMALWLVALGLMLFAAWLTREGLIAQEEYDARKVARRPAVPRKILGSLFTGAGLAVAGFAGMGFGPALLFALLGAGLHFFSFGPDPLANKGMEGLDEFQTDRVAKAVEKAEEHLKTMREAATRAGERQVIDRVDRFQAQVREMIRTVEEDPRDLTGARKFLGVYLMGARDAAIKFADVFSRNQSRDAKSDFMMLLTDLEETFNQKTRSLLLDDHSDLTIEVEVLRERLQQEGIHLDHKIENS